MRAFIVALAIAAVAGAASAAGMGTAITGGGGGVTETLTPTVPDGARQQAEGAIKQDVRDEPGVTFRAVKAVAVASLRHGPFEPLITGPVSVVCGQVGPLDQSGGYGWFFVAIKRGQVLWTATDDAAGASAEAHNSCQAVGLIK